MMIKLIPLCLLLLFVNGFNSEEIHTTKVFIMTIGPWFLNWTDSKSMYQPSQFSYRPSLLNAPDLPSWMFYTYNEKHNRGFMYGAPPSQQKDFQIEVIGLNRKNYEARRRVIDMNVIKIEDPALFEVVLKVDKLNVEEMLDSDRYNLLLSVFRKSLWPESQDDLYITFLAPATHLGARLPLNPTDGEGIVMHIGSRARFSQTLLDLQEEVRPLRNKGLTNCPDFKHTSVERFFKQHNFYLDWCAFQLNEKNRAKEQHSYSPLPELDLPQLNGKVWEPIRKAGLPIRHYVSELFPAAVAFIVGIVSFVLLLNIALCYWEDGEERQTSVVFGSIVVAYGGMLSYREPTVERPRPSQYEAVQKASNTLRSLSTQRDCDESSPRVSLERSGCRPNPPPYTGVHHLTAEDDQDDEEAQTWYC